MDPEQIKQLFKTIPLERKGNEYLMSVAFHEAGHSLVDILYGLTPVLASIVPDPKDYSSGHNKLIWEHRGYYDVDDYMSSEHGLDWSNEEVIDYHTCSLLGGIIGEAFYSGEYDWEGFGKDFSDIMGRFITYGIDEIPSLQPYWNKAFTLIQENRKRLEDIALDLYKYQSLDEQYFTALINHEALH